MEWKDGGVSTLGSLPNVYNSVSQMVYILTPGPLHYIFLLLKLIAEHQSLNPNITFGISSPRGATLSL